MKFLIPLLMIVGSALLPISSHAAPLEKVSIQLKWFHQFQFAGYYAAKEKGFYADLPPQNRPMLKERIFDTHSVRPPNLGGFA